MTSSHIRRVATCRESSPHEHAPIRARERAIFSLPAVHQRGALLWALTERKKAAVLHFMCIHTHGAPERELSFFLLEREHHWLLTGCTKTKEAVSNSTTEIKAGVCSSLCTSMHACLNIKEREGSSISIARRLLHREIFFVNKLLLQSFF